MPNLPPPSPVASALKPALPRVLRRAAGLTALWAAGLGSLHADLRITEFMASNTATLEDQDQAFSDWIELHNPDATPVNLAGWYLTDSAANKTRWQFPAVTLAPGAYLVVFASNKNRREPTAELHTNFALAVEGEYLGLIKPDGVTVASEFAPTFPPQANDVSFGLIPQPGGALAAAYLPVPSPGAANPTSGSVTLAATPRFSRPAGPFSAPFELQLTGAGAGQHLRYVAVPPGPAGATAPEPTESSPRYNGPLAITGATLIRAAVFSDDLRSRGLPATAHYFRLDLTGAAGLASFSTRLPVLVLDQHGYGGLNPEDGDRPAWLYGFATPAATGRPFDQAPEFASPVRSSIRGSSSANFNKKSYNLEILNALGKSTARVLLGSRPFDEWALIGPWFYDPSLLRNAFIYALSNRLGRWAPRTRFVELFFNRDGDSLDASAHAGVYVLTDKIDIHPDRVAINPLSATASREPDITGGYLLKIDLPDPDEYAWTTTYGLDLDTTSQVMVTSPKLDKLTTAQRAYIRGYVQQMENALHDGRASGWRDRRYLDYLDRASWVDHHLLNTFAANPDAFERSSYFHKPRNGRIVAGPIWDFDRALGSHNDRRSLAAEGWNADESVQPWYFGWWGVIATDPEFLQDWVNRWQSLRRDILSDASLAAQVDQLAGALGPESISREMARWPENVSPTDGTYAGEISHLKSWLARRASWIDRQFVAPPVVSLAGGNLTVDPAAGSPIAYTLDGSDPRALGGDLAPNATLATGRVTVPANSNLHARSYRTGAGGTFPGSPWSSAVGGASSTPLTPASRLVNLSSRAGAGADENALIAGVVVADTTQKLYLSRGIGPALAAFGVSGTIPDPMLTIMAGNGTELFRNRGWQTGPDAARLPQLTRNVGGFPLPDGSADSALLVPVGAGSYTLQVSTPSGQSGLGLAEIYELDGFGRTLNLSTRARVGTDERVLIGGFVVAGAAHKRMLVRAVGPSLAGFGVGDALADPVLTLYSGSTVIATNDRWATGTTATAIAAAATRVGAFTLATNTEDAALLITVAPGAYTAEVRGKGTATGVALLEIYEVP